jgi:histidinol-phosphate phosphatase family protein
MPTKLVNAVFLDRDGTLIRGYGSRPENTVQEVEFLPTVVEGIDALHKAGYFLVVVTNQGGIGLGLITTRTVLAQHRRMDQLLEAADVHSIDAYYFCAHHPQEGCDCRKPKPGMLLEAAKDEGLDLHNSFMVGDMPTDMQAGHAAGVRKCLLVPYENHNTLGADLVCGNFLDAAKAIVVMGSGGRKP